MATQHGRPGPAASTASGAGREVLVARSNMSSGAPGRAPWPATRGRRSPAGSLSRPVRRVQQVDWAARGPLPLAGLRAAREWCGPGPSGPARPPQIGRQFLLWPTSAITGRRGHGIPVGGVPPRYTRPPPARGSGQHPRRVDLPDPRPTATGLGPGDAHRTSVSTRRRRSRSRSRPRQVGRLGTLSGSSSPPLKRYRPGPSAAGTPAPIHPGHQRAGSPRPHRHRAANVHPAEHRAGAGRDRQPRAVPSATSSAPRRQDQADEPMPPDTRPAHRPSTANTRTRVAQGAHRKRPGGACRAGGQRVQPAAGGPATAHERPTVTDAAQPAPAAPDRLPAARTGTDSAAWLFGSGHQGKLAIRETPSRAGAGEHQPQRGEPALAGSPPRRPATRGQRAEQRAVEQRQDTGAGKTPGGDHRDRADAGPGGHPSRYGSASGIDAQGLDTGAGEWPGRRRPRAASRVRGTRRSQTMACRTPRRSAPPPSRRAAARPARRQGPAARAAEPVDSTTLTAISSPAEQFDGGARGAPHG